MGSTLAPSTTPVPPAAVTVIDRDAVRRRLEASLARVIGWVEAHRYRGYEPADGNSSVLFPLTGGRVLPMRVLQQVVLRAPFNIRPFIGVRPHESAIARGYMAAGHLVMFRRTGLARHRDEAVTCLRWLVENRAAGRDEFCWGDPYDYATRGGRRPYGEPLLIWSSLIGRTFLDAFDLLGDPQYRRVAESVGRWVLALPAERTDSGFCLSYVGYRQTSIHNASMMGAAFMARLGALTGDADVIAAARGAMTYSCTRQRQDGSWLYGEDPKFNWIDNFHTAYNLSALRIYRAALRDRSFDAQLSKGLDYYRANFVDAEGRARYFHNQTFPVDIQCAAQTIETLAEFSDDDRNCLPEAVKVADWTIANLQAADGHFRYRDLGWTRVSTPMLHWGQGTMVKALAIALEKLDKEA